MAWWYGAGGVSLAARDGSIGGQDDVCGSLRCLLLRLCTRQEFDLGVLLIQFGLYRVELGAGSGVVRYATRPFRQPSSLLPS